MFGHVVRADWLLLPVPRFSHARRSDRSDTRPAGRGRLAARQGVKWAVATVTYLNGSMIDAGGGVAFKTSSLLAPVATAVTA